MPLSVLIFGYIATESALESFVTGGKGVFSCRRFLISQLSWIGVGRRCLTCCSWWSTHMYTGPSTVCFVSIMAHVLSVGLCTLIIR